MTKCASASALARAHARRGVGRDNRYAPAARVLVQRWRRRCHAQQQLVRRAAVLDAAHPRLELAPYQARRVEAARAARQLDDACVELRHADELRTTRSRSCAASLSAATAAVPRR